MKPWTTPETVEISMNAEIGSYQDDADRPDEWPPVIHADETSEEA